MLNEDNLRLKTHLPLRSLESVVLSQHEHTILALHSYDKPDLLLELADARTELVSHLVSIFEQQAYPRFKIHFTHTLLVKEHFTASAIPTPSSQPVQEEVAPTLA